MRILSSRFFVLLATLYTGELAAQAIIVDEGTFIIELAGEVVGTESFKIRRVGAGSDMRTIAQGDLTVRKSEGTENVRSALGTVGPNMLVEAYQTQITPHNIEINLQRKGNRFLAVTSSESYLEEREYRRLSDQNPTIILDDLFAHHYFLLLPHQFADSKEFLALFPRSGDQTQANLTVGSVEPISVGNDLIQAQHLRLNIAGVTHRVWTDGQNRILRVDIPQKNYMAYRSSAPFN